MKPELRTIFIERGTIVYRHRNSPNGIEEKPVMLLNDRYVEASRWEDGRWGFMTGPDAFTCAGGLGHPVIQDGDGWLAAPDYWNW